MNYKIHSNRVSWKIAVPMYSDFYFKHICIQEDISTLHRKTKSMQAYYMIKSEIKKKHSITYLIGIKSLARM